MKHKYILSIIFTFLLLYLPLKTFAQQSLTVDKAEISLETQPGEKTASSLKITNKSGVQISVYLSMAEITGSTVDGQPIIDEKSHKSIANWIAYTKNDFSLPPNKDANVDFSILVPADTEPGGYYGLILSQANGNSNGNLAINQRIGTVVLLTVAGEIKKSGNIEQYHTKYDNHVISFLAEYKNTGTIHYNTGGEANLYSILGKKIGSVSLPAHLILPGSSRSEEAKISKSWLFGRYRAEIIMRDGYGNIQTENQYLWIMPWRESVIVITAVILAITMLAAARKKVKKKRNYKNTNKTF